MFDHDNREPLRPGWYPAGDGHRQRFYAGRGQGWTDRYTEEIDSRDPLTHDTTVELAEVVVLLLAILISAALTISVVVTLANRHLGKTPQPPAQSEELEQLSTQNVDPPLGVLGRLNRHGFDSGLWLRVSV